MQIQLLKLGVYFKYEVKGRPIDTQLFEFQ